MSSISNNDALRQEAAQLWDRYTAIISLRDDETDSQIAQRLTFEATKTFQQWVKLSEKLTMRSAPESYPAEQKLS